MMDEMNASLLRLIILSSVLSGTDTTIEAIIVQPSVTVTLINDSAFFNCSTTSQKVEWLFGSGQYPQLVIYSYGTVNQIYKDRFRVESYTYNNRKWFRLILRSVTKGDAGRYICRDPDNLNDEGREVHLTVLETEPACDSNLSSDGLIIGCGTKPETVQLSCSVRYNGEKIPELQWIKTGENIVINSSLLECSDSGSIYTCNLTMESEVQMEGDSYACQTTQSMTRQYNCTSGPFRIIYVLGEHTELIKTINDKVNCSVNSNSQASCTLSWISDNGTTTWTESRDTVIEFKRPGRYICQASCAIRNNNCTLTIMTVNVTVRADPQDDDNPIVNKGLVAGIVVGAVGAVVVTAICVPFIMWIRRKKKRKQAQNASNRQVLETREREVLLGAENARESSNPSQREPQDPPQRDASSREDSPERVVLLSAENAGEASNGQNPPLIKPVRGYIEVEASNEHDQPNRDPISGCVEQDEEAVVVDIVLRKITPKETENRNRRVRGLTVLDDELFVAFQESNIIEVFPNDFHMPHRKFMVVGLMYPGTIAACATNCCLYVMDLIINSNKQILKVKPDGTVIDTWETDDDDKGRISVSRDGNVVMTAYDKGKVKIYTPDGTLLKDKTIDFSGTNITYIFHAINLDDMNFIIGHGIYKSNLHQVCKIDGKGNVLRSFGNAKGSGDAQLNCPAYVAERNEGSILVADQNNHRIILLNCELKFMKELFTKENCDVSLPEVMFVCEETETPLLFLGCNETSNSGGYVLVMRLDQ